MKKSFVFFIPLVVSNIITGQQAGGASITPDGKYLFYNCNGQLMWVDIRIIEDLRLKEY